jgi:cytochrome c5
LGQDTYEDACAQCHAEGKDEAPDTGDQSSWSDRSPLWSSVLIVHAQNGYLGMSAKGGCGTLSERQVAAAGEYLLSETFPGLPRD